jgi:hypothetical protein
VSASVGLTAWRGDTVPRFSKKRRYEFFNALLGRVAWGS